MDRRLWQPHVRLVSWLSSSYRWPEWWLTCQHHKATAWIVRTSLMGEARRALLLLLLFFQRMQISSCGTNTKFKMNKTRPTSDSHLTSAKHKFRSSVLVLLSPLASDARLCCEWLADDDAKPFMPLWLLAIWVRTESIFDWIKIQNKLQANTTNMKNEMTQMCSMVFILFANTTENSSS